MLSLVRVGEAIEMIATAKNPYIVAGSGIHYSEAWYELVMFAETFGIPVGETHAGRGVIRKSSDMLMGGTDHLGTSAVGYMRKTADLVICIGTQLHDFVTGSNSTFQHRDVKFFCISVRGRRKKLYYY